MSNSVFVKVSVKDELPESEVDVFTMHEEDGWQSQCFVSSGDCKWFNSWAHDNCECFPTHWLKEVELLNPVECRLAAEKYANANEGNFMTQRRSFIASARYILNLLTP